MGFKKLSVLLPLLFVMHCSKKSKARVPQSELKPTPPARVPLEEPTAQPKLPWCETSTSARSGSSHLCQAAALFSKDSRNLVFNDLSITDMIFLNEFKQATRVVLVGNQIKTLGNQIELDSLESLNLSENPISSLEGLSKLKNLKSLNLSRTPVSEKVFENLQDSFPNLRELYLNDTSMASLHWVSRFPHLEVLAAEGVPVSDLSPLARLNQLKVLRLEGNPMHVYPKGASEERTPQRCPLENAPSVLIQFCKEGL